MIELTDREPPGSLVKELRERLPRVRVRWDRPHGLWVIEECVFGKWSYCCYWADRAGPYQIPVYRELPGSAEPLIAKLAEIDMARFIMSPKEAWKALEREMDEPRRKRAKAKRDEWRDLLSEYAEDMARRAGGVRHTFGFGRSGGSRYGRSRLWIPRGSDVARAAAHEIATKERPECD